MAIAGTPKTVRSFVADVARNYHEQMFRPENLVVVAAGNVDHVEFVKLVRKKLFSTPRLPSRSNSAASKLKKRTTAPKTAAPVVIRQNKTLEQAHLLLATPFVGGRDKRRYAADLLSQILGGGTSSRLWQKIREERGLAYSVGASAIMFADCGMFIVSAGTSPGQTTEVVDISIGELRDIVANGVTPDELELAKEQTRSGILLSLEDSAARAASLAQSELLHGRQIPVEESLANVEAVTLKDVHRLARSFFRSEKIAFGALGDLKELKMPRKRLQV
jgi:predicted Zn-dependent peptidase